MASNDVHNRKRFKLDNIVTKLLQNKPADVDETEETADNEVDDLDASHGEDVEEKDDVNTAEGSGYEDNSDQLLEMETNEKTDIPAAQVIPLGEVLIDDVLVKLEPLENNGQKSVTGLEKVIGVKCLDEATQNQDDHMESSEEDAELPEEVQCTSCHRYLETAHKQICRHPILNVLVCKKCIKYYNSSPFGRDEQGIEEQCRWCGDGGELVCCDKCDRAICQKCIKRNLGKDVLKSILESDDSETWFCYCCDQTPVVKLIRYCDNILRLLEEKKSRDVAFKNPKGISIVNGPTQGERRNRLNSLSEDIGVPIGDNSPTKKQSPVSLIGSDGKNVRTRKEEFVKKGSKGVKSENNQGEKVESKDIVMIVSSDSEKDQKNRKKNKTKRKGSESDNSEKMIVSTSDSEEEKKQNKTKNKTKRKDFKPGKSEKMVSSDSEEDKKRNKKKIKTKRKDLEPESSEETRKKKKKRDRGNSESESETDIVRHKKKKPHRRLEYGNDERNKRKSKTKKYESTSESESDSDSEGLKAGKHKKNKLTNKQKSWKIVLKPRSHKKGSDDDDDSDDNQDEEEEESDDFEELSEGVESSSEDEIKVTKIKEKKGKVSHSESEEFQNDSKLKKKKGLQKNIISKVSGNDKTRSKMKQNISKSDRKKTDEESSDQEEVKEESKIRKKRKQRSEASDEESEKEKRKLKKKRREVESSDKSRNEEVKAKKMGESTVEISNDISDKVDVDQDDSMEVNETANDRINSKDEKTSTPEIQESGNDGSFTEVQEIDDIDVNKNDENSSSDVIEVNDYRLSSEDVNESSKDKEAPEEEEKSFDSDKSKGDKNVTRKHRKKNQTNENLTCSPENEDISNEPEDESDDKNSKNGENSKGKSSDESSGESEANVKLRKKTKDKQKIRKKQSSSNDDESEKDTKRARKEKVQDKKVNRKESSGDNSDDSEDYRRKSKRKGTKRNKNKIDSPEDESDTEELGKSRRKGKHRHQRSSSDEETDSSSTKLRRTRSGRKKTTSSEEDVKLISRKSRQNQKSKKSDKKVITSKKKNKKMESSSESESEKGNRAKKNVKRRSKKHVQDSSEDDLSDFVEQSKGGKKHKGRVTRSRASGKTKRAQSSSEEESSEEEKSESEEESSDVDVKSHRGKKQSHQKHTRRRGRRPSSSDEETNKKKTRRGKRKAVLNESDSESPVNRRKKGKKGKGKKKKKRGGDSESTEEEETPRTKGRRRIRNIIEDEKLTEETRKARRLEEERRQRLLERTRILEEEGLPSESGKINKLVLEKDAKTGKPIVEVHEELVQHLKVHQAEGIKFMYNNIVESVSLWKEGNSGAGCIIAQCMGLGKTLQVVSLIHTMAANKDINLHTSLVVAPLNTVLNWQVEFDKWLGVDERLDVFVLNYCKDNWQRADLLNQWYKYGGVMIMGYEMYRNLTLLKRLRSKKQKKIIMEALVDPGPQLVICDEAHILRNDQSAVSKALTAIKTKRRIALTGTPLQNNLIEYHCMMTFVKPNLLGTQKEFRNHFVNPIQNGQCADSTPADVRLMKHRSHILHKMLEGCVQRKDYSVLVPFLPPKHEYVVCVRLSPLQKKMYQHYLNTFVFPDGISKRGVSLFGDFQAFMRIWTHPICLRLEAARRPERFEESDSMESFIDDNEEEEEASSSLSSEDVDLQSDSSDDGKRKTRGRAKDKQNKAMKNSSSEEENSDSDVVEVMPCGGSSTRPGLTLSNESKPGTSGIGNGKVKEEEEDIFVLKIEDPNKPKQIGSTRSGTTFKNGLGVQDADNDEDAIAIEEQEWYDEFLGEDTENEIEQSGKLVILLEILADAQAVNDKVIVFSQSLVSLDLIERTLGGGSIGGNSDDWCRGCDYFRMDGSTSAQMRQRWADIFNDEENKDARLFLISTKAGGLGINLVAANRIVVFDASWNPSHDTQSIFRAYRFGQNKPVFVYRLLAQGTMEEKIYERQVTKLSLSERVVDEHQIERHFTAADLSELYNFTPDDLEDGKERPTPSLPKDAILADLINRLHPKWIVKFHEHDSLLQNIEGEELSEEERKQAWAYYEAEKSSNNRSAMMNRLMMERQMAQKAGSQMPANPTPVTTSASQISYMQQQAQLIRHQQEMADEMQRQRENHRQQQIDYLNRLLGNQPQRSNVPRNPTPQTQIPVIRAPQAHIVHQNQTHKSIPQRPVHVQIIRPPVTGPGNNQQQVRVQFIPPGAQSAAHLMQNRAFINQAAARFPGQAIVINPGNQYNRYKQARPGQIVEITSNAAGNSHQS